MKVNFCLNDYSLDFDAKLQNKIVKCLKSTVKELRQKGKILSVNIEFLTDTQIKALNKKERKIDKVTDVLSFPLLKLDGATKVTKKAFKNDFNKREKTICLGDIFINLNQAKKQSEEFGHSFTREVCYLATHGLLHLFGLDHEEEDEKRVMRAIEEYIMCKNNLKR